MFSIKTDVVSRPIRNLSVTRNGIAGGTAVVSTTLSSFQFTGRVKSTLLFEQPHKRSSQTDRSGEQASSLQKDPKWENYSIY
jgi:hypothetical protein